MLDLNPVRLLPRFRHAYRSLPVLREREGWSRVEIEAFQLDRLNDLWRHARARVEHYRRLAHLPDRFVSLEEYSATVPVLEREDVRAAGSDLRSDGDAAGSWSSTSGSTGLPLRVFWSRDSVSAMLQAKYRFFQSWGVDIFDRKAYVWGGRPASGWRGWLRQARQRLEDWLRRRIRLDAFRIEPADLRRHLARLASYRPAALYGYATATALLANAAAEAGFRCPSLRLAILTSEPVTAAARRAVERGFGVPVASEYGSIETGLMATDQPDKTMRVREDRVIVETVPEDAGTYGLIVTVLDNPAFPLLRYRVGDLTTGVLVRPAAGFAVLRDVIGRSNDLLTTAAGRRVHPFRMMDIFEPMPGVRRWRAHQADDGSVRVLVEPDGTTAIDAPEAERRVSELLDGQNARVVLTDALPPLSSGKHRWIVSEATPSPLREVTAAS